MNAIKIHDEENIKMLDATFRSGLLQSTLIHSIVATQIASG